jgi:hypothetical protein
MNLAFDQLAADPIFIVGAARSGTTWVYDMFSAHPQVAGIYESWLFTKNDGLGSLFSKAHWPPKYSGLGRLLNRDDLLEHTRDAAMRIMSHAIKPQHRYLIEKSPSHLFVMPLISEIFPGARFIHVVRDGRDVSVSVRAASRSWAQAWRRTFGLSIRTSAFAWKNAIRRARRDGRDLGERFFEIRYEEISEDPFNAYRQLFDFCDLPYDDDILQHIFHVTDFARNYKPKETGFRRGGRIGDWRTHFSLTDALIFNLEAGNMLVELGYEKNRRWVLQNFQALR